LIGIDSAREPLIGKEVDLMSTNRLAPRANVSDAFEALMPLRSTYQHPSYHFPAPLLSQWHAVRQCLLCILLRMSPNATVFPSTQLALHRHGARLKRLLFVEPVLKEELVRSSDGDDDGGATGADGAIDVEQDQNAEVDVALISHTLYCVSAPFTACVSFTVCV
jgi:hypothetical protein